MDILTISNERFVTCSQDKILKLFDLNTCECIRTFKGHTNEAWSIDKISNEKIVSDSFDKKLRTWNLNSVDWLKSI
jgi:WD40 repeat protein